jgi:hypothetical protein
MLLINIILTAIFILEKILGFDAIIPAVSINLLPIAWIIKYFTLASVSCREDVFAIKGTNDRRFNSIPIHKYNQFELDNVTMVPMIIVDKNNNDEGVIKL